MLSVETAEKNTSVRVASESSKGHLQRTVAYQRQGAGSSQVLATSCQLNQETTMTQSDLLWESRTCIEKVSVASCVGDLSRLW